MVPQRPLLGQERFEIKFEITIFEKEVLRKAVLRFEKSLFEINDFSDSFYLICFSRNQDVM
jgi:hypothetical protein